MENLCRDELEADWFNLGTKSDPSSEKVDQVMGEDEFYLFSKIYRCNQATECQVMLAYLGDAASLITFVSALRESYFRWQIIALHSIT